MHLDRKTKRATSARARRHRLLACYLTAGLAIVTPCSIGEHYLLAFDAPPISNGNPAYIGKTADVISVSSDALKRVGIRFVDSARAASWEVLSKPSLTAQPANSTPVSRLSPINVSNNASRETGVRIRIPAEPIQVSSTKLATTVQTVPVNAELMKMTVGQTPTQSPSTLTPKPPSTSSAAQISEKSIVNTSVATTRSLPVGTGFAALPSIEPVSLPSAKTLSMPPQLIPPSVETQTSPTRVTTQAAKVENIPVQDEQRAVISMGSIHLKLNDNEQSGSNPSLTTAQTPSIVSATVVPDRKTETEPLSQPLSQPTMISRAPGVVRIPGMTVTANSSPQAFIANGPTEQPALPSLVQSDSAPLNRLPHSNSIAKVETATNPSKAANSLEFHSLPQVVSPPIDIARAPMVVNTNVDVVAKTLSEQLPLVAEVPPRTPHPYEPSIVPVALASTVMKEKVATTDVGREAIVHNFTQGMSSQQLALATVNASTVSVAIRNVQVLTLQHNVNQVKIEDENICKVITSDPNNLIVIGAAIGECKLAVWTNDSSSRETEPQIYKVVVRDTWGDATKNTVSIEDANKSLATMFPDSTVVIKSGADGALFVQGKASTNESAKRIIMLVRKMFLVPVQDRIAVAAL